MLVLPFWSIIGFAVFASGKGKFWGNVWNSSIDLFDFISKSKYLSDLKKGSSGTNLYDIVKRELNEFIDDYYDRYSGLYLKSKMFLKNLQNI